MLFDMEQKKGSMIKVVGVGGGGSNAVNHMYDLGIKGVEFVVCNTDSQALELSKVPIKVQLGPNLTGGMGAGNVPEKGRQACIESIDDVRRFLEDGTKMLFLTAGLGGGTGTGATPIIAKVSRELGILTIAIVTLPFAFEGRKRKAQALEGLQELKNNVDAIIVIGNDKLRGMHASKTLSEAFANADNVLSTAAKGIAEIITVSGKVNVDFQDVYTVMKDSGVAIMGSGVASGEDRDIRAVQEALASHLIEDNDIRGSKNILLNISSGKEEVTLQEIYQITEYIQEQAGYGTDIIWGHCHDESLDDQIVVTVIATGFEHSMGSSDKPAEKVVLSLDDDDNDDIAEERIEISPTKNTEESLKLPSLGELLDHPSPAARTLEFEIEEEEEQMVPEPKYTYDKPYRSKDEIEAERLARMKKREEDKRRREAMRQSFDKSGAPGYEDLAEKEKIPAYVRRNVKLDPVGHSSDRTSSRWTLSLDDDEPVIRKEGNSFIHDKAD